MNETAPFWNAHDDWATTFHESDRVLVDALVRRGADDDESVLPLAPDDEDVVVALLYLARSLRLDHAALALDEDDLTRHVAEATSLPADTARRDARRLIAAFTNAARPLARALVTHVTLDDVVSPSGSPVVVTLRDGVAAYAHLRRLAHAEWRLGAALLAARAPSPCALIDGLSPESVWTSLHHEPAALAVAETLTAHRLSILTGGPGTGKTTAVARVLQCLGDERRAHASDASRRPLSVALCAPTAKAAVRLREALDAALATNGVTLAHYADVLTIDPRSGSVHRLLGLRPDRVVGHEPLNVDLVIVDEVSMLELPLLDQLVARVSSTSRVVLVGDPEQLASVNVGAVLRDVVDAAADDGPLASLVTHLRVNHRSNRDVRDLAGAVNAGDLERVLAVADQSRGAVTVRADRALALAAARTHARALTDAADDGDVTSSLAILTHHVILCATREGEGSVAWWRALLEPDVRRRASSRGAVAVGTPVLVTRNEPADTDGARPLSNGDVGVATRVDDAVRVVFGPSTAPRVRAAHELAQSETAWALTIHKSQGSEYDEVVVSLPRHDTPILTRELLYTAVTRARSRVTIVADAAVLRRTLERRIARVSALSERLRVLAPAAAVPPTSTTSTN